MLTTRVCVCSRDLALNVSEIEIAIADSSAGPGLDRFETRPRRVLGARLRLDKEEVLEPVDALDEQV